MMMTRFGGVHKRDPIPTISCPNPKPKTQRAIPAAGDHVEGYAPLSLTLPSLSRSVITGLAAGRYLNSFEYREA